MHVKLIQNYEKSQGFDRVIDDAIYNVEKKLLQKAKYYSQCKCPMYDFEEVAEEHFSVEKSVFVQSPSSNFTSKTSANQDCALRSPEAMQYTGKDHQ